MGAVKRIALAVFIGVPIFGLMLPSFAGRIVWTVLIASLPLFIILVGYHRWRRICPLAFFARLPARLNWAGVRKASPWLEANYHVVAFSVFFFSLWLRLVATNGDGRAIAAFFVLLSLTALLFGALYTGKTWCNYICPVSFIEKMYTEPNGLRDTANSQCARCTACKKSCPDINEENGYWKEIESRPKRFVYFAYPGLVFAFYFYYFLQSGTWDYYFSGTWTNQVNLVRTAFLPGHDKATAGFFFLPAVPRAAASALVLGACALLSFFVFSRLEQLIGGWLRRPSPETDAVHVRHVMFSVAAFAALVTFYTFAGAPTLRLVHWAPRLFFSVVVVTATLSLVRRLPRSRQTFAEETLARNIVKHWEWPDLKPPKNLREAFLIHTIRLRESAEGCTRLLEAYKEAVREALADGFVTLDVVNVLESLRNQLHIKPADHEKIVAALAEEERVRISDASSQLSAEKRLQLASYRRALDEYLNRVLAAQGAPDENFIRRLRRDFRVTEEEHLAALFELLGGVPESGNYLVLAFLQSWSAGHGAAAARKSK